MDEVENITDKGTLLAQVIRAEVSSGKTTFLTPAESAMQMGFIVRGSGDTVPRHCHEPGERRITTTSEALIVREGECDLTIYGVDREKVREVNLKEGDVVLLLAGGHGLRFRQDTVLLEIKQGPFLGDSEKLKF